MAETPESPETLERIENHSIVTEMQDSYLTYAMSVIMARALPDIRDGLKPSQRRILVAMNDLNLGPRSKHRKCAKIAGDTSGNYHPHGEQVIYPTLVRMAQPWSMRYPLVDSQGNFGSLDGDPPAAMRYTEARLDAATMEMLADLEYETVDFEPNYDATREEPTVLPSKFPNLLVNGSNGIAVGMATNLAPHNLNEICDGIIALIDNPDLTIAELMQHVPGPDFPGGGQICGRRGVVDAYTTGRGSVAVRGRLHVEELRGRRQMIVITEIPYQVLRSTITEKIAAAVKSGTIKDVSAVNDASDRKHPVRIEVELKREANEDVVINQLYQYTPLQTNFHTMNIALVEHQPQTLSLKAMMLLYVDHRKDVIRRRTLFLLRRAKQRAHILEGLILAVGDIDRIIQLIKESPDPATAKRRLMEQELRLAEDATLRRLLPEAFVSRFSAAGHHLTAVQAGAILSMQLQRLTGLEIEKLAGDYTKLVEEITGHEAILGDEQLILDIIREDLYEMKRKYGDDRRTEIVEAVEDFSIEELIPDEQVAVTITHQGYIKRTDLESYRKQGRGGKGIRGGDTKEGDFLEHLFVVSTHDYLLVFTNRGRVYWARVFNIPALGRTSRGRSIANFLHMQTNEKHRAVLAVRQFEESFAFFATAAGTVKKTPLSAYRNPRSNGIIAITMDPDDSLVNVAMTSGDNEIVLATRDGMAIRFSEQDVRAMGRTARGVRGMTLKGDDIVVDMAAAHPESSVLTICENGFGKRTDVGEYRLTRRGGKGVINIKTTTRNGRVVAIKAVADDDELMMITAKGIMLRTGFSQLREIGRATQGVRMIRPGDGDHVMAVAKIAATDDNGINGKLKMEN
ncbi:MAG: DNA gyrase subunit A [Phycisphaerae bacterium]|nr:DNA gyrase subunit A [Phycisphaerae bacterium]